MYKSICLDYLEKLKFKENGINEEAVIYDMEGVMYLLDILEDSSFGSTDTLKRFHKEEDKIYWHFGFRI